MGTDFPIGTRRRLGKYTLIEKLGEGYLGPVFSGFNKEIGDPIAIRILCDGIKWDPEIEDLFHRECQFIVGTQHPNIAAIFHIGKEGQSRYIAMESLANRSLASLIAQKSEMPVETKLSIMVQVTDGLNHAHKRGLLHRNLEPSKIHVAPDGTAKIRDFALAHILRNHLPRPTVRWGAPIYISPEQIENKNCDERSEIFSIGTVFYEFLTLLHPFHDPNSNKALDNILLDGELPTFERFPELPPGIWSILKTCLAKEPDDRYRSMNDLSAACRELLSSLAEDNRLMLSELYAALPPLRKAAAQPGASQKTLQLLDAIQQLAKSENGADYAYLNSLMTDLLDQYPVILAAADTAGLVDTQCLKEPAGISSGTSGDSPLAAEPAEDQASLDLLSISPPDLEDTSIKEQSSPEVPQSPGDADVFWVSAMPDDYMASFEKELDTWETKPDPPAAVPVWRPRRTSRRSYRAAIILLSILFFAAAGYIAWGTEAPAAIQKVWHRFLTNSQNSLGEFIHRPASSTTAIEDKKVPCRQEQPVNFRAIFPLACDSARHG